MRKVLMLLFLSGLIACSARHPMVDPPLRNADVYPNAITIAGLSIAVDAISNPDRVRQYFGTDLTKEDILPVNIIITNRGEDQFLVKPSDILLMEGNNVVDPVPVEIAGKSIRGGSSRAGELAFKETVVSPDANHQGILLYRTKKASTGLYGKVEKLFLDRLSMKIVVTNQDSGERIHFGPYQLSGF